MPCRQVSTFNGTAAASGSYATEADCLNACKEGACCEGTTCSVRPQCQCQGAGQTFRGVGTVCTPNPCLCGAGRCCGPDVVPGYPEYYICRDIRSNIFPTFEDRLAECSRIGGDYTECGDCFSGERGDPQSCRINPLP